jgi:hypothetical protein
MFVRLRKTSPGVARRRTGRAAATVLSTVVALSVVSAAASDAAGAGTAERVVDTRVQQSAAPSLPVSLRNARAALTAAQTRLQARQYTQALASLRTLRLNLGRAHTAGLAQIGAPPADPESDEPPGPGAVTSVLNVEHRAAVGLLPAFNGLNRADVIRALRTTLTTTFTNRDRMLNRVIRLPAEGAGADYADGMADTVPAFTNEVKQYSTALTQSRLSPAGRLALRALLTKVTATEARVNRAFGGGE